MTGAGLMRQVPEELRHLLQLDRVHHVSSSVREELIADETDICSPRIYTSSSIHVPGTSPLPLIYHRLHLLCRTCTLLPSRTLRFKICTKNSTKQISPDFEVCSRRCWWR